MHILRDIQVQIQRNLFKGKVIIIGAGAAGLGAARRLHELGHDDWREATTWPPPRQGPWDQVIRTAIRHPLSCGSDGPERFLQKRGPCSAARADLLIGGAPAMDVLEMEEVAVGNSSD